MEKSDLLILGAGAAGLSAALYAVRAGLSTTVVWLDGGALSRAVRIENYFGFSEPVSGASLQLATLDNLRRLGCRLVSGEVVSIDWADAGFLSILSDGTEEWSRAVLLATGKPVALPKIPGLAALDGHGVSHCAVCDGFFYREKRTAVLGNGSYALSEAQVLLPLASSVTLLTNGAPLTDVSQTPGLEIITQKIQSVSGTDRLTGITLADGTELMIDGLFVANGTAGALDFAAHLGIVRQNGAVAVDASGMTSIPGIFAAGDCLGAPFQVSVSVGRGCVAALGAIEYLRQHSSTGK